MNALLDRPRVLYLTHRVPYPPDKGDRIRNYHVLRQLAQRARVWLIALADEPVSSETTAVLQALCERVECVPTNRFAQKCRAARSAAFGCSLTEGAFRSSEFLALARRWVGEAGFSAVLVSASGLAPYLKELDLGSTPGFVDLVDVDSQKWFDFAAATGPPKQWLYRFEGHRLRRLERDLLSWSKAVFLVSPAEAAVYDQFTHAGASTVATNGVDLDYFAPDWNRPTKTACAFVGAMDYLPNVDAAIWFATAVWPRIRAEIPEAEFRVIGRKPTPAVLQLASLPGVTIVGQVPDVRPFVADCAAVVVPMRLSRGLQNKVLEALAMGKAVVAAPPALAALQTVSGTHLLAAESVDEWVTTVVGLLRSPDRQRALGQAGREYVEARHHWEHCLSPLLDRVAPPSPLASS